jgi:hypothetical protein
MIMNRLLLAITFAATIGLAPDTVTAQWKFGGSTEFFVPMGDLAEISLVGLSFDMYAGKAISGRKWALQVDAGIHWFIPEDLLLEDVPDWVADPKPDSKDLVKISGSYIPFRGSITRMFGRYYLSPRLGVYFPVGDFRTEAGFNPSFGVAPRLGYFFPISREIQFDFAFEYDYVFGDQTIHYAGVSMGLFFGGRRLRR